MTPSSDLVVIGGGIVGLATAWRFVERFADRTVTLLEKESTLARHQTGRNSGVLHSGVYYKPGSLKAVNCLAGKRMLEAFCAAEGVPFERCGKVIVATRNAELPALKRIQDRAAANGVACERIGPERLAEFEPHATGIAALHVPSTGIIDYRVVAERLAEKISQAGGQIRCSARVTGARQFADQVVVESTAGDFACRQLVNCAGLYSDTIAKQTGVKQTGARPTARIVPFRGEYFELTGDAKRLVNNLIYPVPDPKFPFLGVHFTRMISDPQRGEHAVECGPNAVLALAKEGYGKLTINPAELAGSLTYPGFVKLALRHWRMGASEMWRSVSKRAFVQALQRLVPAIRAEHLRPAPAGVRAQAVLRDGTLVDDFLIERSGRAVNVLNAPSPAATASLRIGEQIIDKLADGFA